jgi:hypothetical protein
MERLKRRPYFHHRDTESTEKKKTEIKKRERYERPASGNNAVWVDVLSVWFSLGLSLLRVLCVSVVNPGFVFILPGRCPGR